MPQLSDLFDVEYGSNFELVALERAADGVAFVSRTKRNNGVSARVQRLGVEPAPAGILTVALGGAYVLETFLQPEPTYQGRDVAVLRPRAPMSDAEKLFYAECIKANRYRFSYGRQANRELPSFTLPDPPPYVRDLRPPALDDVRRSADAAAGGSARGGGSGGTPLSDVAADPSAWRPFALRDLFTIERGGGLSSREAQATPGPVPYVGAANRDNGLIARTGARGAQFFGGTLAFVANGQGGVGLCFYQPAPFLASQDMLVLTPRFVMDEPCGVFIARVLSALRLVFNFGRKASAERLDHVTVRLPAVEGPPPAPDTAGIRAGVLRLPFSSALHDPQPSALEVGKRARAGRPITVDGAPYRWAVREAGPGRPSILVAEPDVNASVNASGVDAAGEAGDVLALRAAFIHHALRDEPVPRRAFERPPLPAAPAAHKA